MSLIEPYLQHLNEGTNEKDSSMPNPYDFQSLELDPKVTKQDLSMLGKQLKKMKKYENPEVTLDPFLWLYFGRNSKKYGPSPKISQSSSTPFTIIDKGKRVGVVTISGWEALAWASWVPGHNYAGRGMMKLLEKLINEKGEQQQFTKKFKRVDTYIYKKNIPSLKTAIFLKMKITKSGDKYWGELSYPFWFIEKKKGFFRR